MGGFFKKLCKEICRPFRQNSKFIGKTFRCLGFKRFGNFIERALNTAVDMVAIVGSSIYGGPIGVAAMSSILAAANNVSDKDIFKAGLLGGASAFASTLTNQLVIAKGLGIQTFATTGIINGSIAAASGSMKVYLIVPDSIRV